MFRITLSCGDVAAATGVGVVDLALALVCGLLFAAAGCWRCWLVIVDGVIVWLCVASFAAVSVASVVAVTAACA